MRAAERSPGVVRRLGADLATLAAGLLLAVLILPSRPWALSDVSYFFGISEQIVEGAVPYRDVFLEFPPISLVPILAPRLLTAWQPISLGIYLTLFAGLMAVLCWVLLRRVASLARSVLPGREAVRAILAFRVSLGVGLAVLLFRFDPLPMLLTVLALEAVAAVAGGRSGTMLAFGVAAKLYPAVLAPAVAGAWLIAGRHRETVRFVVVGLVVTAAVLVPSALIAGGGLFAALGFQASRGLQIETLAAGIVQLAHLGDPDRIRVVLATTHELRMPAADAFLAIQPALAIGSLLMTSAFVAWRLGPAEGGGHTLRRWAAAFGLLLVTFMLTNRALSPQHVFWLAPFAVLAGAAPRWTFVAAAVATIAIFPLFYEPLVASNGAAVVLLNLRNALLLALVPLFAWALARRYDTPAASAGRTEHVRERATDR